MSAKTLMTVALSALAALTLWTVGSRAVLGDPAAAVDPSDAATAVDPAAAATAAEAPAPAGKPDAAAVARAKKHEKIKKLGCFQCHSFDAYLNGKPKPAKPPGGAAEVAAPSGCGAGSAGQGECRPVLLAQADEDEDDDEAEAKPAAGEVKGAKGDDKGEDGDDEAKDEEEEEEQEEEDSPPDPKDFAHGPHEEEGVGHCHQCHAMQGHFQVKVRMEACAACH